MLEWSEETRSRISGVNAQLKAEIDDVSDWDRYSVPDLWDYPVNCQGDCEDVALEKRRRLSDAGFPSAAFTMAIAFHEDPPFPHALLQVETTRGTWVLDSLRDPLLCWTEAPYIFTHRERVDGLWERYVVPRSD